jgi:hypothetical protein
MNKKRTDLTLEEIDAIETELHNYGLSNYEALVKLANEARRGVKLEAKLKKKEATQKSLVKGL